MQKARKLQKLKMCVNAVDYLIHNILRKNNKKLYIY